MTLLSVFFAAAALAPLDPPTFQPGAVAPSLDGVQWFDPDAAARAPGGGQVETQRQMVGSSDLGVRRPSGNGYPAWYGFPVLVLALPEGAGAEAVAFAELVQRANHDRGLVVVTLSRLAPAAPAAQDEAEKGDGADGAPAFAPPSATLLAGRAPEDSPWCPDPAPRAIVLGPTGEVVGVTRAIDGKGELVALLEDALGRYPAVPLQADLGAAVREAQQLYFAGQWEAAGKGADKLAKRLARTDAEGAAAAQSLVAKVDEHERALRAAVIEAAAAFDSGERLALLAAALRRGFPRSRALEDAENALAAHRKDFGRAAGLEVAEQWVAALPGRPALFPEVVDTRGRKHVKALEALTKRVNFDGPLTRRARHLLLRAESAPRSL